ncbi:helix-turn-helix domain-containing protein [Methylobacter luteus]|uniref:helix-turn-helix domain-containing protein n=1 Tax=Methylobacter luteus TaxID=415 RepID=UPI0004253DC7|nr:helix-turn-helix transcriptional regulator [Methylobacter luteus]
MSITHVFGSNLKKHRIAAGISQEKLAEICGLHRTYIGAVERGERNITLINAEKIAQALQIDLAELVTDFYGK